MFWNIEKFLRNKYLIYSELIVTINTNTSVFQNPVIILDISEGILWICNFTDK